MRERLRWTDQTLSVFFVPEDGEAPPTEKQLLLHADLPVLLVPMQEEVQRAAQRYRDDTARAVNGAFLGRLMTFSFAREKLGHDYRLEEIAIPRLGAWNRGTALSARVSRGSLEQQRANSRQGNVGPASL